MSYDDNKPTQRAVMLARKKVTFTPPYFMGYLPPDGFLPPDEAAHALFYYNTVAFAELQRSQTAVELEGETTLYANFQQLFNSIARMYGIRGEEMIRFWPAVDLQCHVLGIGTLPNDGRYRFNSPIVIK